MTTDFSDLEDLPAEFPELVRPMHQPVPGRTTYRHATSVRRYVVASVSATSVILEAISGHARDIAPDVLAKSDMWELVTA
jgi:hypothetical protein